MVGKETKRKLYEIIYQDKLAKLRKVVSVMSRHPFFFFFTQKFLLNLSIYLLNSDVCTYKLDISIVKGTLFLGETSDLWKLPKKKSNWF